MKTNPSQIKKAIAEYLSNKKEISAVYLFGSYAHGQQRPFSDIDLGILFSSSSNIEQRNHFEELIPPLSRLLRKDVDLTVMNSASERLLFQIFAKGSCILVNNPKHLAEFKMTAFSKIADFGYYRTQLENCFTRKILQAEHGR